MCARCSCPGGAILEPLGVFAPGHVFKPKCAYFQICVIFPNHKPHDCATSGYMLGWTCTMWSCNSRFFFRATGRAHPPTARCQASALVFNSCPIFKPRVPWLCGWLVRVMLNVHEIFMPLIRLFSSLSVYAFKFVSYIQTESLATAQKVITCYVGCVRGVRSTRGAIWGPLVVSASLQHVFKPKCAYFQICVLFSNWESHDCVAVCYILRWMRMRCTFHSSCHLGATGSALPLATRFQA